MCNSCAFLLPHIIVSRLSVEACARGLEKHLILVSDGLKCSKHIFRLLQQGWRKDARLLRTRRDTGQAKNTFFCIRNHFAVLLRNSSRRTDLLASSASRTGWQRNRRNSHIHLRLIRTVARNMNIFCGRAALNCFCKGTDFLFILKVRSASANSCF